MAVFVHRPVLVVRLRSNSVLEILLMNLSWHVIVDKANFSMK